MRRLTDRRPSAAMILSIIALFAALGGTSYAAATISGKQVKNGTLTGADVKNRSLSGSDVRNNSLGGGQVNESKLGQVPSSAKATQADSAAKADTATTAMKATTAESATKATTADTATKATTADAVSPQGVDTSAIKEHSVTAGKLGTVVKRTSEVTVASGTSEYRVAACLNGETPIGGGTFWNDVSLSDANAAKLHVVYSNASISGWQARGYNATGDNDAKLEVSVMCLQ